jgi:hypothetical protein
MHCQACAVYLWPKLNVKGTETMQTHKVLVLILLTAAIAGCGMFPINIFPSEIIKGNADVVMPRPAFMDPVAKLRGSVDGTVSITLGVANLSHQQVAEVEDFDGRWQIMDADGAIRAQGRWAHLGSLQSEEAQYPMTWQGRLDPGSYTLVWGAPELGSLVKGFTVEVSGDTVRVLPGPIQLNDTYPPDLSN